MDMSSSVETRSVVFTAQSKQFFYCRDVVCEYALNSGVIPLNPFRVFEYFLGDRVNRDLVRLGNNNLIRICDELWVFGPVADGVYFEILYAKSMNKPIRFFTIATKREEISEITPSDVQFEPRVHAPGRTREFLIESIVGRDPASQLSLFPEGEI